MTSWTKRMTSSGPERVTTEKQKTTTLKREATMEAGRISKMTKVNV